MGNKLIIFTRYPEPGKTKTRLIPVLGAEGAAQLQQQMTEHTLGQMRKLQTTENISIEIYFTGGNQQLMTTWLGTEYIYQPQDTGGLGERMSTAFHNTLATGAQQVVIIGIDCPDLNTQLISQAFSCLKKNDLVLGPAADGGYYLIGLRRLIPELFQGISWGTSQVLTQTLAIAEKLNLSVAYLAKLNDVDLPEDLPIWEKYSVFK